MLIKISLLSIFALLLTFTINPTILNEIESAIFFNIKSDRYAQNIKWRLYVWKDIINETLKKPFLGWGFGKKFVPPTIVELGWGARGGKRIKDGRIRITLF